MLKKINPPKKTTTTLNTSTVSKSWNVSKYDIFPNAFALFHLEKKLMDFEGPFSGNATALDLQNQGLAIKEVLLTAQTKQSIVYKQNPRKSGETNELGKLV